MNQITVFEWMSEIDPVLIARAAAPVKTKRSPGIRSVVVIAAVLAALMLVGTLASAAMLDSYVEQRYEEYDGTLLHALDIVLTQDDNVVSSLLLEENKQALHALFDALRRADREQGEEQETKPLVPSEGLEFKEYFPGSGTCLVTGIGTCTDTDVVIPQTNPDGYEVIGIAKNAFQGCAEIKSITTPDGMQFIEEMAFAGCTTLESVTIADSVTQLSTMLFVNCESLKTVKLPSGITNINWQLFSYATGLEKIIIPDTVESIDPYAFEHCTSLKSIEIPPSVQFIGHGAFRNCENLTFIILPEGITEIKMETFNQCNSMTGIVIPKSVTVIEQQAFWVCKNLKDIYYTGTQEEWDAISVGSLNYELDSVTVHFPEESAE